MKVQILLISGGCIALLAFAPLVHADPAKAEDACYNMAVHYKERGFFMSPTNTSGVGPAGFVVKVMIPITKGLDYLILVGGDRFAVDLDLYVYDEDGQLILDDRRATRRQVRERLRQGRRGGVEPAGDESGVKFRASYTGTVEVFVHIAAAQGLASYAVLVGRRGIESTPSTEPRSLGWEPTFKMGESPTPAPEAPVAAPPTRPSPKHP
jgi:hypothetical protein